MQTGGGVHAELIPGTFRPVANRDNDYLMDRAAQKAGHYYSGIKGIAIQDASLQESMGPIAGPTEGKPGRPPTTRSSWRACGCARRRARWKRAARPVSIRSAECALGLLHPAGGWAFKETAFDAVKVREGEYHVAV